jgi:hypothetical protein
MKKKQYRAMTAEELAAATKQFNEPAVAEKSRPLTPEERKQWKRAQRKSARQGRGKGAG